MARSSTCCNQTCLCAKRARLVWINQLDLVNWRNHAHTRITFEPGVTVLVGPNGQGKTNVVEAIRYLSTLSSHRVAGHQALISDGAEEASIHASLTHHKRSVSLGLVLKKKGSSDAAVNGQRAKVSEVPQWVSCVMFSPEDMAIVRGEPGVRRAFMDELVTITSPAMAGVIMDYERVLRQRNTLLKGMRQRVGENDESTLAVWTEKLTQLGARITWERLTQLDNIAGYFREHYRNLAHGQEVGLAYRSQISPEPLVREEYSIDRVAAMLAAAVAQRRGDEKDRGQTLVGPHRDDLDITISGKPARTHASQGEAWSLAIALRLALARWVSEKSSGGEPIIILDDVFSELDASRRATLANVVAGYPQLIVTAAVEEDLPAGFEGVVWEVREGVVAKR